MVGGDHPLTRASGSARASAIARIGFAIGLGGCAIEEDAGSSAHAIIGGEASDQGEYAATGALVRGRSYRCTATLIAPDVALTAAHCLGDDGFGELGFTLDPDLTDGIDGLVPVLADHQHPEFRVDGEELAHIAQRNDIGVIVLAEPIEGVPVETVDLDGASLDDAELTLCGYGRDWWSTPNTAGRKRDATVFIDRATSWELQTIDEDPQPCKGDSGGPLFANSGDGRRLVGLVSRASGGSRMCDTGAIYTRVAPYGDWIDEASLDRDGGCAAAGAAHGFWPALLGWLILVLRPASAGRAGQPRRSRRLVAVVALLAAACGTSTAVVTPSPRSLRGVRVSGAELARHHDDWRVVSDRMMGGSTAAEVRRITGARGARSALELAGDLRRGHDAPFAGALYTPPMQPVDYSAHRELVVWVKGDGRTYQVMLLSRSGARPVSQRFVAGPEWRQLRLSLAGFRGADLSQVTAILFGAVPPLGRFRLALDEVELR